ncbi:hypothetical protein C8R41DRAFT_810232 [Lentinula lateritia]|uniref:PEBP-like protein n=1 Tax=Lentinula lateritia TaxID=40482 RepID=A0ABQ8VW56_9AGAR|nr:hypothetical protein C8R41DRAFT_810232 [Lentinula lateritia]
MQLISIKVCSALLLGFLSLTKVVSAPVRATSVGDSPFSESNPASPDMNTTTPHSLSVSGRSGRPYLHRQSEQSVQAIVEFESNVISTFPPTQATLTALHVILRNTIGIYYPHEPEAPEIELAVKGPQPALQKLQFKVLFSDPKGIVPNEQVYQVLMRAPWLSEPGLRDGDVTALSGYVVANFGTVLRFQNGKGQFLTGSWDPREKSFDLNRFA